MKQTAVEWLMPKILELNLQLSLRKISARNCELEILNLFDQAKEMEKEQIIKAWNTRSKIDGVLTYTDNRTAEQYYKETYESNT